MSLFYPRICKYCDRALVSQEELLCLHCLSDLPRTNYHKMEDNPFLMQLKSLCLADDAFAYVKFNKQGIAQKLVHQLKYAAAKDIGLTMGRWFAQDIQTYLKTSIDCLLPIPLHIRRQRTRGYNQAGLIAEGMSEILGIPVNERCLFRTRYTRTQTLKGKVNRWLDAQALYQIRSGTSVEGLRILLVDDVVTTGATISGAVSALQAAGASYIAVACIATGK